MKAPKSARPRLGALVLYLLDPEEPPIPDAQLRKVLDVVESWMVRRVLVRATTKSYTQVVSELITELRNSARSQAGDVVERYLTAQKATSRYWPDDDEVRGELRALPAYRRLSRSRLRMMLEAVEDWKRGWRGDKTGLGGERVARGKYAIEHVMPRKWAAHWPLPDASRGEAERDRLIHTIGNLTLLTAKLNAKASNAQWLGSGGKREALEGHDVLMLNRELLRAAGDAWTEEAIRARTDLLATAIVEIWPVPEGHRSGFAHEKPRPRHKVELSDLINVGSLEPGMPLFPRRSKFANRVATLLPDGQIDLDGSAFPSPSAAATRITGKPTNGWWFFLVNQAPRRSLRDVWRDYVESLAVDVEEDDDAKDEGDEDDDG